MANEIANLNGAVSALATKIDSATARVTALEAKVAGAINPADVQAAADAVTALGTKVDALSSAPAAPTT